ncbi:MAG: DMT family transporter [Rhodobacteraceae bacterium]|nr:DMT family transporter [Paracoccaceae bacterium]
MRTAISYRQGVLLVLAAGVMWSFMGLLIRLVGEATTWQVLFYRSLGMIPVLYATLAVRTGGRPGAAMRRAGATGVIGGACLVVAFAAAIFAIQSTTVANAVFLFSATPLLSAILGRVLLGEAVRAVTWLAIAVAMVGIFIMVREGLAAGAGIGNLAALASAAAFAVFTVLTRREEMADATPAILTGAVLSVAVSAAAIAAAGTGFALPLRGALIALGMGAVILGVGLSLFALGGRVVPAAEMSLLALLEVILGPVWVWLVLGETATLATFAGGAIVLAALVFNTLATGLSAARALP